jgi:hypothetical protein
MLSTQYARWVQASRVVADQGHYAQGSMGQLVEGPWMKTEREAHALFLKTAEHFGLDPVGRVRLGLAELHRRSLQTEMQSVLGGPVAVDSTAEDFEDLDPGGLTESVRDGYDEEEPEADD